MSLRLYLSRKKIPEDTIEFIMQKGACMCLNKGAQLIRERDVEHYLYYIEKGCCRFFTIRTRDVEEITFQFAFEGEFVNSLLSFKTGQPSAFTIETLSPCEIWAFHKKALGRFNGKISYHQTAFPRYTGRTFYSETPTRNADAEILSRRVISIANQ